MRIATDNSVIIELKRDKTLAMLSEGDRVWVYIPKTGYVGVGEVIGERLNQFVAHAIQHELSA